MHYFLILTQAQQKQLQLNISHNASKEALIHTNLKQGKLTLFIIRVHLKHLYSKNKRIKMLEGFIQQLANYLELHISITESLQLMKQSSGPNLPQFILSAIDTKLRQGLPLTKILEEHSDFFDPLTISLVEMGLKTGQLHQSLKIWLEQHQHRQHFRDAIKKQLFYPGLLFLLSCGFVLFFISTLLPKYQQLFANLKLQTPDSLHQLKQLVDNTHLLAYGLIVIAVTRYHKLFPGIKDLYNTLNWFQWTQLLFMMLKAGFNLNDGLILISDHIDSRIKTWQQQVIQKLRQGISFSECLKQDDMMNKELRMFFVLTTNHPQSSKPFYQATVLLEKRLKQYLHWIEHYLQPLLLVAITMLCSILIYILYMPLLEMGKFI